VRRQILTVALSAVVLAALLLGVPLAAAIDRNAYAEERGELERAALQAAVVVSPDYLSGDPAELPEVELPIEVGLYTVDGDRVAGDGPARLVAHTFGWLCVHVTDCEARRPDGRSAGSVALLSLVHPERTAAGVAISSPPDA
jgi:hypothetical protein